MVANQEIVQNIAKFIFPLAFEWQKPKLVEVIGPYSPKVFEEFEAILEGKRKELISYVKSLPPDEIERMNWDENSVPYHANDRLGTLNENSDFMEFYKNLHIPRPPSWFAGGFGNLDHVADFSYWSKAERLTLVEATCVSIGFEPLDYFEGFLIDEPRNRDKEISRIRDNFGFETAKSSIDFYLNRRELIKRKFVHFSHDRIHTENFYKWILEIDLEIPESYFALLEKRFQLGKGEQPAAPKQQVRFENREKLSLSALITAMAIEEYGYDPTAKRSPIPKEISDICIRLGIELSDDTIRKYLRLGAKQLPENWKLD